MAEFTWIKMSLIVILLLRFTAAVIGETFSVARAGEEVTLPCENVLKDHHECNSTTWLITPHKGGTAKELVSQGKIKTNQVSKDKSDRLSVTADCSLAIKNVTVDDVGRYTCRQFDKTETQQGPGDLVHLSVINMEEHQTNEWVKLICSVVTYGDCRYSVKWQHDDDDDKNNVRQTLLACGASVEFTAADHKHKSNVYDSLKCNVTDQRSGQTSQYKVRLDRIGSKSTGGEETPEEESSGDGPAGQWWWYIVVAVGLASLLILIFVLTIRWRKTKGNKTQMDENAKQTLNPALTQSAPETSVDMADPEDGVSYASISYTKKSSSNARVCGKDDDDEGAVTYSTVKTHSSCAGASAELNSPYATVSKPSQQKATV